MSYHNAISANDPQAIEKLTQKLEGCTQTQTFMKQVNAYFRKADTCFGCPGLTDDQIAKLHQKIERTYSWEKMPFASYELTNNNAEIRRLKQRIAELETNKNVGFVGWKFEGGEVVANEEACRLQILFDEKPPAEQREALKSRGFRWTPSVDAWQRQLNGNAICAASYLDFLCPADATSPLKLQPQATRQTQEQVR